MSLENIGQDDCGYLTPNPGPGPSLSQDGYLLPDKQVKVSTWQDFFVCGQFYDLSRSVHGQI